ncbi:hypothetical protein [Prosthecobacter sp.]|uniref:hypothetical protein n=1 Tax=Prosthecobacter sp. TaxID=1965333 RepID=UPI0024883F12|nr:hypothetical protein [Prosthecobacter sp.]MDI1312895.1 hypothetical protein [Prosthecobacter sp.]
MGDATPALVREMNQRGPPVLVPKESPLSAAGNLLDLNAQLREIANRSQVQVDAASGKVGEPNPTPGFLTLDSLHGTAVMAGIPFCVVVDGCLQDVSFIESMTALGFQYDEKNPSQFYYVGQSEVVTREAWDMAQAMRNFGRQRPFLSSSNPVTLAAKPGTFAMAQANPFVIGGPAIGPLALRAHRLAWRTMLSREPWDLFTLVRRLAEFNGVGEINLEGSISWSDFDGWKKAQPFAVSTPDAPVPDVKAEDTELSAVVKRFKPGIGTIQDFAYAANTGEFLLSDFKEGIWTWHEGQPAQRVEEELPFSSLGALADGSLLYYGGQTKELRSAGTGHPLIAGELYLGFMARGAAEKSLLVVEDDSVIESPSKISHYSGGKLAGFAELETTGMLSAVEWPEGVLFYTTDSSLIQRWEKGTVSEFCRGLSQPQWLACDDEFLYCLSATSRTLHRITSTAQVSRASLDPCKLNRALTTRAFQAAGSKQIFIASGEDILVIDTSRLRWK